MIYLISFESNEMLHDYSQVVERIKSLGDYQHPMTTLWFVNVNISIDEIYDIVKPLLREKDRLFITEIKDGQNWQGWLAKSFWLWLNKGMVRS